MVALRKWWPVTRILSLHQFDRETDMSLPNTTQINALDFVKRERDGIIDFAARLIATPSPNPGGSELAAAQAAEDQMRALGMQDTRIVGRSRE